MEGEVKVKYYQRAPYQGLPAQVPFDKKNGWYVATRQNLPGFGDIKAYDDSGRLNSFYLCNVGPDQREEFNSLSNRDDECMGFTPGAGRTNNIRALYLQRINYVLLCPGSQIQTHPFC